MSEQKNKRKSSSEEYRNLNVRIRSETYNALEGDADKNYRSLSKHIRFILDQYLEGQVRLKVEIEDHFDKRSREWDNDANKEH